jgi:hypothetical protein
MSLNAKDASWVVELSADTQYMKLTLPWLRQARTTKRANGHPRESFFRFDRQFEFHEFTAVDAPEAFRWDDVSIRFMDDRLWRRVFARRQQHSQRFSASVMKDTTLPRDVIVAALKQNEGFRFMTDTYINIDKSRIDPDPPSKYKTFEWTDDPLEGMGIEAWHSDIVLIDGEFWIACPCPSYAVEDNRVFPVTVAFPKMSETVFFERSSDKLGDVCRMRRPFDERGRNGAFSVHFGVDEFEYAINIARSGAARCKDSSTKGSSSDEIVRQVQTAGIEILMPQCATKSEMAPFAMIEAFERFMESVSQTPSGHLRGIEEFDSAALRGMACVQAFAYGRRPSDIDPDDLADAVEACLECFAESGLPLAKELEVVLTTSIARVRNRVVSLLP